MKYLFGCCMKIIFLFWFEVPTKYGIRVSWPNKLSILISMPLHKIFRPSVLYLMTDPLKIVDHILFVVSLKDSESALCFLVILCLFKHNYRDRSLTHVFGYSNN